VNPSEIVNAYLTAYTSGDVDRAASLVSEDFSFQGPMQATAGRSALRKIVAHVAANARGHRVLRQWQDSNEVCTIYQFNVETAAELTSLLVSEWNTVRAGQIASSLMIFDTGPFRGAGDANSTVIDRSAA
jgi:SnoaL-like domain